MARLARIVITGATHHVTQRRNHLILVTGSEDGLRATSGEAHRRYTRRINFRKGWRGHLS